MKIAIACVLGVLLAGETARADKLDGLALVKAMKDELTRAMDKLELPGVGKPYFLSYQLWDTRHASVEASFGSITNTTAQPFRYVAIDLRVGDYALDNSNFADNVGQRQVVSLAVDDDYDAIRHALWLATDGAYKHAGEALERKQAVMKEETKSGDDAASFSKDPPAKSADVGPLPPTDVSKLEALAKKLSAVFRKNPDAYRATVSITDVASNRYFVSSEGALAAEANSEVRVSVHCSTQADDGMLIQGSVGFVAASADKLPPEAEMIAQAEKISRELSDARKAPVVDDYAGPILFRGAAAGQLVRALLAENLSGTPAPKGDHPGARSIGESELVGKVGQRILPAGMTVVDDPTIAQVAGKALTAHYGFDDEGIPAQRVTVIENGTFKRFLMSRTPRKGFEHSTGHGRSSPMAPVRAHPSNLIVSSNKGVSDRDLVKRALAAAKDQGLTYVLAVDRLGIGDPSDLDPSVFSGDSAVVPNPVAMKRIYLDGHEELVRGGSFGTLQLRALKDMLAVGSTGTPYHYTGSGLSRRFDAFYDSPSGFAVSIVAPALLFRDIDIKKPLGPRRKPPIAPRP